jgi:hypothetical protein
MASLQFSLVNYGEVILQSLLEAIVMTGLSKATISSNVALTVLMSHEAEALTEVTVIAPDKLSNFVPEVCAEKPPSVEDKSVSVVGV